LIPLPEGKFDIFYTDPPWKQEKGGLRKSRPKQGKVLDYETISIEEIKDIHKEAFNLASDSHNVFMWTIDKYLHQSEEMMKELGYELHTRMIWDKTNGIAPAFTVRYSHEYLLWFYKKGKMLKPHEETRGKYTTVFTEKSRKHSKKPISTYEMIEDMFRNTDKLEMFARETRQGWKSWGNEID